MHRRQAKFSAAGLAIALALGGGYLVHHLANLKPPSVDPQRLYGEDVPDAALLELCQALPVVPLDLALKRLDMARHCACFLGSEAVRALAPAERLSLAGAWHDLHRAGDRLMPVSPRLFDGFRSQRTFAVTAQWSGCLPPPAGAE